MPEDIAGAAGGKHLACGQNSGQNRRQDRGQDRVQDRGQVRVRDAREPDSATLQKARPVQPNPPDDEDSGAAETAFLLGTPANAVRLMASIREAEAGLARPASRQSAGPYDRGWQLFFAHDYFATCFLTVEVSKKSRGQLLACPPESSAPLQPLPGLPFLRKGQVQSKSEIHSRSIQGSQSPSQPGRQSVPRMA